MTGRHHSFQKKEEARLVALLLPVHRLFLQWRSRRLDLHRLFLRGQTDYEAAAKVVQELIIPQVLQLSSWVAFSQEECQSCAVEEALIRGPIKIRTVRNQNPLFRLRQSLQRLRSLQELVLHRRRLLQNHPLHRTRWLPIFANRLRGQLPGHHRPCRTCHREPRQTRRRRALLLHCRGQQNLLHQYLQENPLLQLPRLLRLLPVQVHHLRPHPLQPDHLLLLLHDQLLRLHLRLPHHNLLMEPVPLR